MERRRIVHGLNAVIQILQLVHQLAAEHQLLVINQRKRLRHAPKVDGKREKCKTFDWSGINFLEIFDPPPTAKYF
jgi:hypothetical protein